MGQLPKFKKENEDLSYDPVGLMQSLRNDFFRREEFLLDPRTGFPDGSISWVLLGKYVITNQFKVIN